jgi:signal transduction histidine kinase
MNAAALDRALRMRVSVVALLSALALELVVGWPVEPASTALWVARIVLGLGLAEILLLLIDLARRMGRGAAPGTAVLGAVRGAARAGASVAVGFAAGWWFFQPGDAVSIAVFAFLEAVGLLAVLLAPLVGSGVRSIASEIRPKRRTLRLALALLGGGAVAASLLAVGWLSYVSPGRELACPVLPNGVIPAAGIISANCPFAPLDRVVEVWVPGDRGPFQGLEDLREKAARWPEFVEWTVIRDGVRRSAAVPVVVVPLRTRLGRFTAALLLAGIMLTTALIIAWNTASPAALPFLAFNCLLSTALSAALCAGSNEYLRLLSAVSVALFPAVIAHLGLYFPRERSSMSQVPALPAAYYAGGALLVALTLASFRGSAEVWILSERMVPVFALIGWVGILLSAASALRADSAGIEAARARVALAGSAAVAAVAVAVGQIYGTRLPFSYRTGLLAVVLLQAPVATALVRYSIFDLHLRPRRVIASLAYSAAGAGALTVLVVLVQDAQQSRPPLEHSGLLFSALVLFFLLAETLRGWLQGAGRELVSAGSRRRHRARLRCAQQLAELRDPDASARIIAETISESMRASWVTAFLRSPELGLRPAHAIGEGALLNLELAREADTRALAGEVVHLSRSAEATGDRLALAGVDVVLPLRTSAGTSGLVLLGEREDAVPYTLDELEHLTALAAHGGVALENARLARELVDAERSAARGNLAVGLAHEIGKPLRVIEDLSRSLAYGADRERERRDLDQIAAISKELIESVYGFVRAARDGGRRRGAAAADVVSRAVQAVQLLHGPDRVSVSVAPDLPDVVGGDELVTVLSNLLDNALLASAPADAVHLFASADDAELRFEVVDDGHGMDDATAARAFDLFFTTRGSRGGSGVGLALCREIVGQLGGRLELRSRPGKGTRVCVRMPLAVSG